MQNKNISQSNARRPRVVVVSYSCHPYGGSEAGAGWGVIQAWVEVADLVVLVAPYYMPAIEKWQQNHIDDRLSFVGVPFPDLESTVRPLRRWYGKLRFLRYLLWLRSATDVARRLEAEQPFDASLHAAIGSYWLPSPITELQAPSVWGPVGGATVAPRRLWRFLGWRGLVDEWVTWLAIRCVALFPSTRRTWRRATIRIAESENTRRALPRSLQAETRVINRAILQQVPIVTAGERKGYLLFPSQLEGRKGGRLALHALARTPSTVRLIFVADGYERRALEQLAQRLGVANRTEFQGRIPRDEMFRMMAEAAAVVFAGLREEGGCALSEAMQLGTPVIVLGIGGARIVAEANTDPNRVTLVEPRSARQTVENFAAAMTRFSVSPLPITGSYLDREGTKRALQQALKDVMAQ